MLCQFEKNGIQAHKALDERAQSAHFRNHARNHQLVKARCPYNVPLGTSDQAFIYGWMDGMDGISKVSLNFVHTLYVYRNNIYVLI